MHLLEVDDMVVVEGDIFWVQLVLDGLMQGIWRLRKVVRYRHVVYNCIFCPANLSMDSSDILEDGNHSLK